MPVYFDERYVSSPHRFETTRKSQHLADHLVRVGANVDIVDPRGAVPVEVVEAMIRRLHDPDYIQALQDGDDIELAETSGFTWGPTTWSFATAHSHGIVAAIQYVAAHGGRAGSLSSGLHHACPSYGAGFCTINGLAVGAAHALTGLGSPRRVMILDFDAHCGGGTHAHLLQFPELGIGAHGDTVQIDLSVSGVDSYQPHEPHHLRLRGLDSGSDEEYLAEVRSALRKAAAAWEPGMIVIYNAGVDPVNVVSFDDPMETIASREDLVMEFAQDKPAVFTLAGGYTWGGFTEDDVSALHHEMIWRWASPMWMG